MNCQTFRTIVHEIDRPDGLEVAELDSALGHAQTCSRCARQLYYARELEASLRAVASADANRQPSADLEARLLGAFREQRGRRRRRRVLAGWLGAAAALALGLGAGLLWRHESSAVRAPESSKGAVTVSDARASVPVLVVVRPVLPPAANASVARVRARTKLPARPSRAEDVEDFLPLPFADADAPLVSGEVVRIRLSEGDLGLLGVPVNEESSARSLTADVVIGDDGVARAIRFVPASMN